MSVRTPRRLLRTLDVAIIAGIGIALVFLGLDARRNLGALEPPSQLMAAALLALVGAILAYLLSHVLRAVRLAIILGPGRRPFPQLLGCHLTLAVATYAMPFKLGDLIRALEFFRLSGNDVRAVFAVWIDRLFDVAVILLILLPVLDLAGPGRFALIALAGFLATSIALVLVCPGALVALIRTLQDSTSHRSLRTLRWTAVLHELLGRIPRLGLQTFSLLLIVTLGVWLLELLTVALVLVAMALPHDSLAEQAGLLLRHTLLSLGALPGPQVAAYRCVTLLTLAVAALATLAPYLRQRIITASRDGRHGGYVLKPLFLPGNRVFKGRQR